MGPIEYAKLGLYVFPCAPGQRVPVYGLKWKQQATNDVAKIEKALADPRFKNCNWACVPGMSDLAVVDIDQKNNVNGAESLLAAGFSLPPTFQVATPNDGRHAYMIGAVRSRTGVLPGVDIKSIDGYVLIPGSVADGKPYTVHLGSLDKLAPLPAWVHTLTSSNGDKPPGATEEPLVELDIDHNVQRAIAYLEDEAPEAVEGQNGDITTFKVAARVKDFGVSKATALELMLDHWNNAKAFPPWEPQDLERKVSHAFKYGMHPPGVAAPEAIFAPTIPMFESWATWDAATRPPRKRILGDRYMAGYVTMTVADGGVGKSSLTFAEAVAVATGRPITGLPVHIQGPVMITNLEDPFSEVQNKLDAIGQYFNIPRSERWNIYAASGYCQDWRIVSSDGAVNQTLKNQIIANLKEIKAVLWVVDPFVFLHGMDENSNSDMGLVMRILSTIAEAADVGISLAHHSRKPGSGLTEGSEGDMHVSRGASAIIAAARIAHTAGVMGKKAAREFGIQESDRKWYIRIDEAKANMSPPMTRDMWLRRVSVTMPNGDNVGTLEPVKLQKASAISEGFEANVLDLVPDKGGVLSLKDAVTQLKKMETRGGRGGGSDRTIRRALLACFQQHGMVVRDDGLEVRLVDEKCIFRKGEG